MRCEYVDDRTPEQMKTHTWVIRGLDRFLSNWGKAAKGNSFAGWACKPEHARKVFDWVESRSDMRYVTATQGRPRFRNAAHVHIYVVDDNHPALAE